MYTLQTKMIYLLFSIFLVSTVYAGGNPDVFREIEHKKAKYLKRHSDAWKEGGRLIGEIKHPPDSFTITFKSSGSDKIIYTYTHPARLTIYQTKRLPPGKYNVTIEAKGFLDHTIRNVKILARRDCMIDLIFGTRVFDSRL